MGYSEKEINSFAKIRADKMRRANNSVLSRLSCKLSSCFVPYEIHEEVERRARRRAGKN